MHNAPNVCEYCVSHTHTHTWELFACVRPYTHPNTRTYVRLYMFIAHYVPVLTWTTFCRTKSDYWHQKYFEDHQCFFIFTSLLFAFFSPRIYFFLVCFFGRTVFARASCSCFDKKKKIFKLLTGVYVWTWLCCYFIQDETELVCDCVRIASQTYIRFGLFFFSFSFEKGTTQRKKLKESRNQKNIWHSHETYMSEN